MSLLGKILAVFNVLAAIGFFSVAILDWSKRQSWETAVYRQSLVPDGLPLDDKEPDANGKPLVRRLTEDTKKDVFSAAAAAGAQPVATQVDEVNRVQGLVTTYVTTGANAVENQHRLATVLLPFAATSTEYEDLAQLRESNEPKPLTTYNAKLASLFSAPSTGTIVTPAGSHSLNTDERKLAIATLLVNLIGVDNSITINLPRAVAVSGMVNTARALETQTQAMRKMAEDLNYAIERERSEFVVEQTRALSQARDLADELRRQKRVLAAQQDLVARQVELVKGLEKEIDQPLPPSANQPLPVGLKQRLDAAKDAVKVNLDIQAKMEESLFNARKQLRDIQDLNRKRELQLRELEEKGKSR